MVYINTINHPFNIMPEPDTESEISDIMKYVIMALMLVFGISYVYSSSTTTDLPAPDSKRSKPTIKQKPDNIAKNANNKIGAKRSDSIDTIGHAKAVHVMFVRPIATHPAIALRDHVSTWIVKVPLTPFKAPLIELPFVAPEDQPPFLLYKPEYLTPVRNQGDCGSCWAFAVCDMLADRMMIASGGHFRENLSVQQLLACFDRDGCDGGSPEEACFFMQSSGFRLNTSKFMKYKQYKGGYISSTCPKDLRNPEIGIENDSVRSLVEYIEEEDYDTDILQRNISNMKRELIIGGPFYCAMSVYDDLFSYSGTSVYERNPKADIVGGHAIEIIGYCDKGVDKRMGFKDTAYWICRNSWGKNWPTESTMIGYFTIKMGVNMCGIESRCGVATPFLYGAIDQRRKALTLDDIRYTSYYEYINS